MGTAQSPDESLDSIAQEETEKTFALDVLELSQQETAFIYPFAPEGKIHFTSSQLGDCVRMDIHLRFLEQLWGAVEDGIVEETLLIALDTWCQIVASCVKIFHRTADSDMINAAGPGGGDGIVVGSSRYTSVAVCGKAMVHHIHRTEILGDKHILKVTDISGGLKQGMIAAPGFGKIITEN